jgi:hypothetical protein
VTSDEAKTALLRRLEKMARARNRATANEEDVIVMALQAGAWHSEIAVAVDRSREYVRRIANRHGIPGRYPRRTPPAAEPDGTAATERAQNGGAG